MSDAGVTLITGAGSGMGRLAPGAGPAGVSVAALDVNAEGLEEACEAEQLIKPHTVDVTDGDAVADAVARIERDQGPVKRVYSAAAIMPWDGSSISPGRSSIGSWTSTTAGW